MHQANWKADLGGAGFEEPVEAEAPGPPDCGLELVPGSVAELVDHAEDEAVLLLCNTRPTSANVGTHHRHKACGAADHALCIHGAPETAMQWHRWERRGSSPVYALPLLVPYWSRSSCQGLR